MACIVNSANLITVGFLIAPLSSFGKSHLCAEKEWIRAFREDGQRSSFRIRSLTGRGLIESLRVASGKGTTTSNRKEKKAVLSEESWRQIQADLDSVPVVREKQKGIRFCAREKTEGGGRISATITYYGMSANFYNHGITSKLRMRVRFYVSYKLSPDGHIKDFQRSELTRDRGMLELKIKNPGPAEEHSVHKYRIPVRDELLTSLFEVRPGSPEAAALFTRISWEGSRYPGNGNRLGEFQKVAGAIHVLGQGHSGFLKPLWVITYNRRALSFSEPAYPLAGRKARRGTTWPAGEWCTENDTRPVEYQLTIDKNVRFHRPRWALAGNTVLLEAYVDPIADTAFAAYPQDSVVVEFKDPAPVAWYSKRERSEIHNLLHDHLLAGMKDHMYPGFSGARGKAGHLKAWLKNPDFCPAIRPVPLPGQACKPQVPVRAVLLNLSKPAHTET